MPPKKSKKISKVALITKRSIGELPKNIKLIENVINSYLYQKHCKTHTSLLNGIDEPKPNYHTQGHYTKCTSIVIILI